jgi:hypothetical protein
VIIHGGTTARKALGMLATLILTAGLLVTGNPAHADSGHDDRPTYIECAQDHARGKFYTVVPAGPARVAVIGSIRPCRTPSARDAAVIVWVDRDGVGRQVPGNAAVYYRGPLRGMFVRVVTVDPSTRRLCLADTPGHSVDCFGVRVPVKNGKPRLPVVSGRTTTANVAVATYDGLCGTCW